MNYMMIVWILVASIAINYIFFIIAFCLKSDHFTDITYAASFSVISIMLLIWQQNFSVYQILIFILINLWAIRLGSYLLTRIFKIKKDTRFDNMRNHFFKFFGFWNLQALSIFIIGLPGFFALTVDSKFLSAIQNQYVAFFVFIALAALMFETIADIQKYVFYNNRKSKDEFITKGLWKISRHPNYFGEIVFWTSICVIYLFGFIINNQIDKTSEFLQLLFLLSPTFLILVLNFLSGVPMLEKKSYKNLKDNLAYMEYINKTSCVIPFVGKKGLITSIKNN